MNNQKLVLSDKDKALWARAATTFPGERLHQVLSRTLVDLPKERELLGFYELRRRDVPTVFQTLLKLQNTGFAWRLIEIDGDDFREVLKIEVTLFDAIMAALLFLLDIITHMLSLSSGGGRLPPLENEPVTGKPPAPKPYIPSWKRDPARIGMDDLSL